MKSLHPREPTEVRLAVLYGYVFLVFGEGSLIWNHWLAAFLVLTGVLLFLYDAALDL